MCECPREAGVRARECAVHVEVAGLVPREGKRAMGKR